MNKKSIGGLSKQQVEMLAYLRRFIESKVYSPSYDEIASALGYTSKSGVSRVLSQLQEGGLIRRPVAKRRAIEITAAGMSQRVPEVPSA